MPAAFHTSAAHGPPLCPSSVLLAPVFAPRLRHEKVWRNSSLVPQAPRLALTWYALDGQVEHSGRLRFTRICFNHFGDGWAADIELRRWGGKREGAQNYFSIAGPRAASRGRPCPCRSVAFLREIEERKSPYRMSPANYRTTVAVTSKYLSTCF